MINYIKIHLLWLAWLSVCRNSIKWFFKLERALDECSPRYLLWLKRYSRIIYKYHTKSGSERTGNYITINNRPYIPYINNIASYEHDISYGWDHRGAVIVHQESLKRSPMVMKYIVSHHPETVKYYSKELQQLLEFYKI